MQPSNTFKISCNPHAAALLVQDIKSSAPPRAPAPPIHTSSAGVSCMMGLCGLSHPSATAFLLIIPQHISYISNRTTCHLHCRWPRCLLLMLLIRLVFGCTLGLTQCKTCLGQFHHLLLLEQFNAGCAICRSRIPPTHSPQNNAITNKACGLLNLISLSPTACQRPTNTPTYQHLKHASRSFLFPLPTHKQFMHLLLALVPLSPHLLLPCVCPGSQGVDEGCCVRAW